MSTKSRTGKFVAPKPAANVASSDSEASDGEDDDFAFYQSRFPLPTTAPKQAQPARRPAASPAPAQQQQQPAAEWVEVHDSRKDKYQQRRSAREAELALLQAEAEENRRNEFSSLPRFVPYARDASGKWLGAKSHHVAKPKQLGVIEDYIIPEEKGKQHKKKRKDDLLVAGGGGAGGAAGREWGSEAEMAETVAGWIERQPGEEVMTVAQIGERIQARVGDSWNKRFKMRYGPLVEWLRGRQQLDVQGDRVTVRAREEKEEEETSEARDSRQRRERERRDAAARDDASAVRLVSRAERSWLAFALYLAALLAVVYGAYSVWSGRNMNDLARQLAQQLEAMEAKVADVQHAVEHSK